jgi:hypothetical protein
MAVCEVNVLGEQFSWAFPPVVNATTGEPEPYRTTLTVIRDALTVAGLNVKEGRALPERWVFMRALQSWIEGQTDGAYDHKISAIIASRIPDDGKPLSPISIQIDRKMIDRIGAVATVEYLRECTITLDRATDKVHCTDATVEGIIRASMAYHRETRDGTDVGRIVIRMMQKELGVMGLIPWNGRGTYFVLHSYRATLDKVCAFLAGVGATVTRAEQYEILPWNGNGSATCPNGTAPNGNQSVVREALSDQLEKVYFDAKNAVFAVNSKEYKRDGDRRNAERDAAELLENAVRELNHYRGLLADRYEELNDNFLYVQRLAANRARDEMAFGADGLPVVPTVETVAPSVLVINPQCEIDTVLETELAPEPLPDSVISTPENDFRDNVISTAVYAVTPVVPLSVVAPSIPAPGTDYVGEDGVTYRAPKNPEMYAEMVASLFSDAA